MRPDETETRTDRDNDGRPNLSAGIRSHLGEHLRTAYEATKASGFYEKNPGADTAIKEVTLNTPTENSRGLRFGNYVQIRTMFEEELEAALGGQKSAEDAVKSAQERGNEMLREFESQNQ